MKILIFGGGLGNQIFGCAFYKYLQQKYHNHKIYGIYSSLWLKEHNGFEVDKVFDVDLPKTSLIAKVVAFIFFLDEKIQIWDKLLKISHRFRLQNTIGND